MEDGRARLPPPAALPNSDTVLPYFMVGDAGFPLRPYLTIPYSRLARYTPMQRVFNFRLSGARRIVECAFGLMAGKWQALKKPLGWGVQNCEQIILAIICLHNYLIEAEQPLEPQNVLEGEIPADPPVDEVHQNVFHEAENTRAALQNYFVNEGERMFQYERL